MSLIMVHHNLHFTGEATANKECEGSELVKRTAKVRTLGFCLSRLDYSLFLNMLFPISPNAYPFISDWETRLQTLEFNLFLTTCKLNSEHCNLRLNWVSPKKLSESINIVPSKVGINQNSQK